MPFLLKKDVPVEDLQDKKFKIGDEGYYFVHMKDVPAEDVWLETKDLQENKFKSIDDGYYPIKVAWEFVSPTPNTSWRSTLSRLRVSVYSI